MKLYRHIQSAGSAGCAGRRLRRCDSTAAFTMVEIAMALGIIGFALVAILGILPMGMDVQKNNRRETIINQDANFLIETIRGGAHGLDDLTNYVISITNYWARYDSNGVAQGGNLVPDSYDYLNSRVTSSSLPLDVMRLTNGERIVGLLSMPKYLTNATTAAKGNGIYQSNYVVAYMRAMSGVALEKFPQDNSVIKGAAFRYRLVSELTPYGGTSNGMFYSGWTNYAEQSSPTAVIKNGAAAAAAINAGVSNWVAGLNDLSTNANPAVTNYINLSDVTDLNEFVTRANRWLVTRNLRPNLYELRLVFRWPVLPGRDAFGDPKIGNGRQVYRAMISGALTNEPPGSQIWFMRPQNYVDQQAQ